MKSKIIVIAIAILVFLLGVLMISVFKRTDNNVKPMNNKFDLKNPIFVSVADYESILQSPVKFSLRNGELNLSLPLLPNITSYDNSVKVVFSSVTDFAGVSHPIDQSEDSLVTKVSFINVSATGDYLSGSDRVPTSDAGISDTQVKSVSGNLVLNLPVNIQAVTFTSADLNTSKPIPGGTMKIVSWNKKIVGKSSTDYEIEVEYSGPKVLVTEKAVSADGKDLYFNSYSSGAKDFYTYSSLVDKMTFYVAEKNLRKVYPFTTNNTLPAPSK